MTKIFLLKFVYFIISIDKINNLSITKTILINSITWDEWNDRFITQIVLYNFLNYIKGKEDLLSKSKKPIMASYI